MKRAVAGVAVMAATVFALVGASTAAQHPVQPAAGVTLSPIGLGTARNTVNVVIFRKQSLVTHGDTQFAAYYDGDGHVVLARRNLGSDSWQVKRTDLTGSLKDAHNAINIGVDGDGFLHLAWNHHNQPINYRRGAAPLSLDLIPAPVTGKTENHVTYPEFHLLPGGDLLLLYRDGASGRGNLVMDRYDVKSKTWTQLFSSLVDGQGERNAYWQACTDDNGAIHLSWVWRESGDVATNHDLCYARSTDGGRTWTKSTGEKYHLPITLANAEHAADVPQKHELINQTSMMADRAGHPYIATYWRADGEDVPQYRVVYNDGHRWHAVVAGKLTQAFRLGGGGTKRVPISRPQILVETKADGKVAAQLVFRAEERGSRASLASCPDITGGGAWTTRDLTTTSVGQWEPTYDPARWTRDHVLDLFVQYAQQLDAEGVGDLPPQTVYVAEVKP